MGKYAGQLLRLGHLMADCPARHDFPDCKPVILDKSRHINIVCKILWSLHFDEPSVPRHDTNARPNVYRESYVREYKSNGPPADGSSEHVCRTEHC